VVAGAGSLRPPAPHITHSLQFPNFNDASAYQLHLGQKQVGSPPKGCPPWAALHVHAVSLSSRYNAG